MASQYYTFDGAAGTKASTLPGIVVTTEIPSLDVWTELDGSGGLLSSRQAANTGNIATALVVDTGAQSQYCEVTIGPGAFPPPTKSCAYLATVRISPAGAGSTLRDGYNLGIGTDAAGAYSLRVHLASALINTAQIALAVGDTLRIEVRMSEDRLTATLLVYHNGEKVYTGTRTRATADYPHAANRTGAGYYPEPYDHTGAVLLSMEAGELFVDTVAPTLDGPLTALTLGSNAITIQAKAGADNFAVIGHEWTKDGGATWTAGEAVQSYMGLVPSTVYTVGARVFDKEGFRSNVVTGSFTTASPDTTPATLSGAGVTLVGERSALGSITASEPGYATAAFFPTSTPRTHEEIIGAQWKVSANVLSGANAGVFVLPNLPALKTFYMHVAHSDFAIPANNATPVVAATPITTLAPSITATRTIQAQPDGLSVIAGQQPVVEASVSTFQIVNDSATDGTRVLHRGGVMFAKGLVPTGSIPVVMRDANTIRAQFDQRAYWSDGSLKFAVMHMADTDMAAAETRSYVIWAKPGTYAAPAGIALATVVAALPLSVAITSHKAFDGAAMVTFGSGNAFASLAAHAVKFTRVEKLHSGAVSDGWSVWGMVADGATGSGPEDAHLKCHWYINVWKDAAGAAIDYDHTVVMAQDWWSVPNKTRREYSLEYKDGATTVQAYTELAHCYQQHWAAVRTQDDLNHAKRHWRGAVPTLIYKPNKKDWVDSKQVPPYDDAYLPDMPTKLTYSPLGLNGHRAAVNATGAYMGRGMLSNTCGIAFMRQDAQSVRTSRVGAHGGLSFPAHFRDDKVANGDVSNRIIPLVFVRKTLAATTFASLGAPRNAYCGISDPVNRAGWVDKTGGELPWSGVGKGADCSHTVNHSAYNYMLEGEPYMLRAVLDNATQTTHGQNANSYGAFRNIDWHRLEFIRSEMSIPDTIYSAMPDMTQQRSVGFGIATIGFAAALAPHDSAEGAYMRNWLREIGEYMQANALAAPADAREFGGSSRFTGTQTRSHWMMAFAVMGCYQAGRSSEVQGLLNYGEMLAKFAAVMVDRSPYHTTRYHMFNCENSEPYSETNRYLPNGRYMVEASLAVAAGSETGPFPKYLKNGDFFTARYDASDGNWRLIDGLPSGTRFYAVESDGVNCKFSLTQGGTPYAFQPTGVPGAPNYQIGIWENEKDTVHLVANPAWYLPPADSYGPITHAAMVYARLENAATVPDALYQKMKTYIAPVNSATFASWKMKVGE